MGNAWGTSSPIGIGFHHISLMITRTSLSLRSDGTFCLVIFDYFNFTYALCFPSLQ